MNHQKLSALLKAPPHLVFLRARVSLLRLTVPADLYQSGIVVELEGIEVKLETNYVKREEGESLGQKNQEQEGKLHKKSTADRSRSTQSLVHDPGGPPGSLSSEIENQESSDEEDSEQIPLAVDLAQSFLQEEEQAEKEKLKAAIVKSRRLDTAPTQSGIEDDASAFGVGNALSLPSFLAAFLKGVGDRMQFKVKNVVIDLALKLDLPSDNPSIAIGEGSDVVTIRLSIEDVNLLGVMPARQSLNRARNQQDHEPKVPDKESLPAASEFRHVVFTNINVMLVSDASVFVNLSRFDVPPSPTATQTSSVGRRGSKFHAPTSSSSFSDSSPISDVVGLSGVIERDQSIPSFPRSGASSIVSDGQRFADPEGDEDASEKLASVRAASLRYNRYEDSVLDDPYDTQDGSQDSEDEIFSVGEGNLEFSRNHGPRAQEEIPDSYHEAHEEEEQSGLVHSGYLENLRNESSSHQFPSQVPRSNVGNPSSYHRGSFLEDTLAKYQNRLSPSNLEQSEADSRPDHSGSTSPKSEDLTQSKIFSHEEAESMYMSAISHDSLHEAEEESAIPGRWDDPSLEAKISAPSSSLLDGYSMASSSRDHVLPISSTKKEDSELRDSYMTMESSERSPTPKPDVAHMRYFDQQTSKTLEKPKSPVYPLPQPQEDAFSQNSDSSSTRLQNPLVIVKKIISLDSVHVILPVDLLTSAKNGLRGSEQVNSDTDTELFTPHKVSIGLEQQEKANDPVRASHAVPLHSKESREPSNESISIQIGQLELLGDIGLTKLTILVIQQNMTLLEPRTTHSEDRDVSPPSPFCLRLKVAGITWKFLDSVRSFSAMEVILENPLSGSRSFTAAPEVLLKALVSNLEFVFDKCESSTKSKLSIEKASFGYVSDDILSFDSDLKMRESTGDILAPVGNDVVLTVTQSSKSTKVDLTTLPLRFVLDLRRLDETFSWFGGFSSILGLGSSMMSTVTVVSAKPAPSQNLKRPRGVHFEHTVSDRPAYGNANLTQKFTARLGGLSVVLQGANCTFRLDGTALKVVSRVEGIGLQVDKLRFTGPFVGQSFDDCTFNIYLANIRMEYMSTPKEVDLARLLSLLSPSKDKYEQDDDILIDTLLHQRRQGGVIRITIETLHGDIAKLSHLQYFIDIAEELKKLSTVAKYLPEDDRPGILTFFLIRELQYVVRVNDNFGSLTLSSQSIELAHVTLPSLTALGIKKLQVHRNRSEELIGDALQTRQEEEISSPTIMARFIGNEMEPVIKVKVQNLRLEYHVSTLLAAMALSDDGSPKNTVTEMISSVTTLKGRQQALGSPPPSLSQASSKSDKSATSPWPMRLDIAIRDSIIGLNPLNSPSRGLVVLTNAHLNGMSPKVNEAQAIFEIKRASLLIIDDKSNINLERKTRRSGAPGSSDNQIQHLLGSGFVSVSYISSAKATLSIVKSKSSDSQLMDVEIRDDLFVLESCADSTQTLQTLLNGLKPPVPQSTELKYRTEIVPVEDMLASFSGDAFATSPTSEGDECNIPLGLDEGDMMDDEVPQSLEYVSSFYNPNPAGLREGIADSMLDNDLESLAGPPATREIGDKRLLESFQEQYQVAPGNAPLDFQENHFGTSSTMGGTAHRWDTKQNTYGLTNEIPIRESPLKLRARDIHIIWNLFDGYDWQHTRDIITKAVTDIESKAAERISMKDKRKSLEVEEDEGSEIGDFLFNSIYIGVPANRDPKDLARQVNRNLDDLASETESYAASSVSGSPNRQGQLPRAKGKKLRLTRSKYHKMTFELRGVSADLVIFPPDAEETQSSIDIRVQDLDIFDHVPTSTWKKFATYMRDAGERESGTSMIHLEILNVKPVPTLAASEIILKVCFSLQGQFFNLSSD